MLTLCFLEHGIADPVDGLLDQVRLVGNIVRMTARCSCGSINQLCDFLSDGTHYGDEYVTAEPHKEGIRH